METEEELNAQILKTIEKIRVKFPELVKYIGDMPLKTTAPDGSDPTVKNLKEYLSSLEAILTKYAPNHEEKN